MCQVCVDRDNRRKDIAEAVAFIINDGSQIADAVTSKDLREARWLLIAVEIHGYIHFHTLEELTRATLPLHMLMPAGAVRVRHPQWYQGEVCHLVVAPAFRGNGLGGKLLDRAEAYCASANLPMMQATIRVNNVDAQATFESRGWERSVTFTSPKTGNRVGAWHKEVNRAA